MQEEDTDDWDCTYYRQGHAAFYDSLEEKHCPYDSGSHECRMWVKGWNDACDEGK